MTTAGHPQWIEAGLLVRGQVRRALVRSGVQFTETKGGLESVFVIHEEPRIFRQVYAALTHQT